ncbi:MAG: DNA mismatch repair protein MutL, partial [Deltaproteobacteria bacterium]
RLGGETFLIKAAPEILSSGSAASLIKDLAGELSGFGGSVRVEERIEGCLMRIACHSVVRGRRVLTKEEGMALLRELSETDFAGYCPHGRPVVRKFDRGEIEAMFKR